MESSPYSLNRGSAPRHSKGFAMVLVLAMLVLLSGLVLAFLIAVRTDLTSSTTFEKQASVRLLAETSVNLVIGQIQEATQRPGEAWISQPGMIRTFDTSGNGVMGYKLYSDDQMRVSGTDNSFNPANAADLPSPAELLAKPDVYVDLNSPILTTLLDADGTVKEHRLFPVIDPGAQGEVEGFSYDAQWKSGDIKVPTQPITGASLAMPLKWLYLLKDGTISPGVEKPGGGVTIAGVTKDNPPTARIAFWADDETSKVNINTASGGVPWDTPVCNTYPFTGSMFAGFFFPDDPNDPNRLLANRPASWPDKTFEADYAQFQPARNEFQRYPGHPATTSLLPVLGASVGRAIFSTDPKLIWETIYKLIPRYVGGLQTSLGGRRNVFKTDKVVLDSERLYASLDELLYTPALNASKLRVENSVDRPDTAVLGARRKLLERAKFFLTANGRAPEVTLANKPRVVTWPVPATDTPAFRTPFDRLFAFCGTIGSSRKPYFFTRSNAQSATVDWTTRNQEIYRYLQSATAVPIPGFSTTSFLTKLGADRDQVLTEIFDYIRCLNLADVSLAKSAGGTPVPFTPYATAPPDGGGAGAVNSALAGVVVPIEPPAGTPGAGTRGFGRIATVSELAIVVMRYTGTSGTLNDSYVLLYPELFSPMAGFSTMGLNMKIVFENLSDLKINGVAVPFPNQTYTMQSSGSVQFVNGSGRNGGYMGIGNMFHGADPPVSSPLTAALAPSPGGKMTINAGSKIKFRVEAPASGPTQVILQNFEYTFQSDVVVDTPSGSGRLPSWRIGEAKGNQHHESIQTNDSVLSLIPSGANASIPNSLNIKGDMRFLATEGAQSSGNMARFFSVHPKAGIDRLAHNLRANFSQPYQGVEAPGKFGNLVKDLGNYNVPGHWYNWTTHPDVPQGINGVTNVLGEPGDWDNGPGLHSDGPYVNKADEGCTAAYSATVPYIGDPYAPNGDEQLSSSVFSPNRQMPSPVMFGSLPTGIKRGHPWQTLLFRPKRDYLPGADSHPGGVSPPDHLLLDLFWMPVVEPYAISEPFSTAGKINLNYQIAPFTYIRRDTGIRAVFAGSQITALNPSLPSSGGGTLINRYKIGGSWPETDRSGMPGVSVRFPIDSTATLKFFEDRFAKGKPFVSASEICDVPLVPTKNDNGTDFAAAGDTVINLETKLATFWNDHKLTGDNSLERPYAQIYPRVTTKSNTFTVHVRAQRLATSPASAAAGEFNSARDRVAGEFRGSFVIERFLDPNSDSLVKDDGAGNLVPVSDENDSAALLGPYKFRVLHSKQIAQ